MLDPGETADPNVVWGPVPGSEVLTVTAISGSIEVTVGGETRTVSEGATLSYPITFAWSGLLPPLSQPGASAKVNTTVPVKFQLVGPSAGITTLQARLYLSIAGGAETPASSANGWGNLFRYDAESQNYILNWDTRGLSPGAWTLRVDMGDGVTRTAIVTLVR